MRSVILKKGPLFFERRRRLFGYFFVTTWESSQRASKRAIRRGRKFSNEIYSVAPNLASPFILYNRYFWGDFRELHTLIYPEVL